MQPTTTRSATHSQREKFIAELIRRAPAADYSTAQRLMRYSGTYGRLIEKGGYRTFAEERKLERVSLKIRDLAVDVRCGVSLRGERVVMTLPDNSLLEVPRV